MFIVLEGVDGSGKTTQFKLLAERLRAVGYDVITINFPRYEAHSSYFVRRYLAGEYGPASEISPYSASLFYALDRFEAGTDIRQALDSGKIVLTDRYVGSNMAHQGSKFGTNGERRGFFIWAESLEYELLGIPRPDINFYLSVPADVSLKLISGRSAARNQKPDEHENDTDHIKRTVDTYELICDLFPKDYKKITCTKNGRLLSVAQINNLIWSELKPLLPQNPPNKPSPKFVKLTGAKKIDTKQPTAVEIINAAAKISLLDVLQQVASGGKLKNQQLLEKLAEAASPDFFIPKGLKAQQQAQYKSIIEKILAGRSEALQQLRSHKSIPKRDLASLKRLINLLLPMATLVTTDTKIESGRLLPTQHSVDAKVAKQILKNGSVRKNKAGISLIEAWPRNEFELLASGLYTQSNLSQAKLLKNVENLSYREKSKILKELLVADNPDLETMISYRWEVVSDLHLPLKLAEQGLIEKVNFQKISPINGYQIPALAEKHGLDDYFRQVFGESAKLYKLMMKVGHQPAAEHGLLLAAKVRWQFSTNLRSLRDMQAISQSSDELKDYFSQMVEDIFIHHPQVASLLKRPDILFRKQRD